MDVGPSEAGPVQQPPHTYLRSLYRLEWKCCSIFSGKGSLTSEKCQLFNALPPKKTNDIDFRGFLHLKHVNAGFFPFSHWADKQSFSLRLRRRTRSLYGTGHTKNVKASSIKSWITMLRMQIACLTTPKKKSDAQSAHKTRQARSAGACLEAQESALVLVDARVCVGSSGLPVVGSCHFEQTNRKLRAATERCGPVGAPPTRCQ